MSESNNADRKTGIVVERLTMQKAETGVYVPAKRLISTLAMLLMLVMWITPVGLADQSADDTGQDEGAITSSITDTENLLGSNVSQVTDAIDRLHEQTGVSVRLLYLSSFSAEEGEVDQWASDVLESTDPDPNTVLLAVASHDGNLVVAVSSNSDEWLRRQSTVDELSQAALDPLVDGDTPDWSASALAMIDHVDTLYRTSTSSSATVIGAAAFGGVALVLIIIAVIMVIKHRRRGGDRGETSSERDAELPSGADSDDAEPSGESEPVDGTRPSGESETEPSEEPGKTRRKRPWPARRKSRGRHGA